MLALLSLGLASVAFAAHHESDESHAAAKTDDAYPLNTCVVSGEELGSMGDPIVYMHKVDGQPDREVRFCCRMCVGRFKSDPAKYLAKLDDAAHAGHDAAMTEGEACCEDGSCASCQAGHEKHDS
ncbi:hypothetical protein [Actomonas aquatica]|uniref:Uncharacterized protein n=1 Tax=Actomonas aquatica TaxID=2866162 RepID=A0ABZ1CH64_9BACT|nr:hypothetical protein [Opitutus sp. WL0086]WRQ89610.1 hypothetical protein K1X11_009330 [Opitutus sp. WL0086]